MTQSKNQPIGFCFINTAHPSEATSFSTLSQIRSHAAKDIRARARRSQPATLVTDKRSQNRVRRCNYVASAVAAEVDNKIEPSSAREQQIAEKSAPLGSQSALTGVLQIPWLSSRDPYWTPVRPLSAQELFLLDHCMSPLAPLAPLALLPRKLPDTCTAKTLTTSFYSAREVATRLAAMEVTPRLVATPRLGSPVCS